MGLLIGVSARSLGFDLVTCPGLGPPFYPFFGGGFPYQNRLQKKGTLILASLLEDLVWLAAGKVSLGLSMSGAGLAGVRFGDVG